MRILLLFLLIGCGQSTFSGSLDGTPSEVDSPQVDSPGVDMPPPFTCSDATDNVFQWEIVSATASTEASPQVVPNVMFYRQGQTSVESGQNSDGYHVQCMEDYVYTEIRSPGFRTATIYPFGAPNYGIPRPQLFTEQAIQDIRSVAGLTGPEVGHLRVYEFRMSSAQVGAAFPGFKITGSATQTVIRNAQGQWIAANETTADSAYIVVPDYDNTGLAIQFAPGASCERNQDWSSQSNTPANVRWRTYYCN